MLEDLGEMRGECLGLLFVTSGSSLVLFSDGRELCLQTFKPFGGFPHGMTGMIEMRRMPGMALILECPERLEFLECL